MTRTTLRTARKTHLCDCGRRIRPGDRYLEHVVSPGDFFDAWGRLKECSECASRHGRAHLLAEVAS